MPPCLTLSIIRYGSRVKWSNPGKGVAPSPTPWCSKLSKREPSGHPRLFMSKSSHGKFCLFVSWNIHKNGIFSYFCFLDIVVLLILVSQVLLLVAIICLYLFFFMLASGCLTDLATLSSVLANPIPPPFPDTYSVNVISAMLGLSHHHKFSCNDKGVSPWCNG